MPDNRRLYNPSERVHETPRSARQSPRSTWPNGRQPKHGGVTVFNRRPFEQRPRRPVDHGKG